MRVVLDQHGLGGIFGVFHGTLAQLFFVLICAIAVFTGAWWTGLGNRSEHPLAWLRFAYLAVTLLILGQLILGATMRHQHAGLAIPDFPLAYNKIWPDLSPDAISNYNQHRVETVAYAPITAFQVGLQMIHRLLAFLILIAVAMAFWLTARMDGAWRVLKKLTALWLSLIVLQVFLGAATIWTKKSADIATAHVAVGALSLLTGSLLTLVSFRLLAPVSIPGLAPESFRGNRGITGGTGPLEATTRPG